MLHDLPLGRLNLYASSLLQIQKAFNTNLKRGLPLENINKVAGPFVEAWAHEQFEMICDDPNNQYELINVQAGKRLIPLTSFCNSKAGKS